MVIKLPNLPGNIQMLKLISAAIGGYVSTAGIGGNNKNNVPSVPPAPTHAHAPASSFTDLEDTGQKKEASKSKGFVI
jgi:hypothetical protein